MSSFTLLSMHSIVDSTTVERPEEGRQVHTGVSQDPALKAIRH